MNRSLARKFLSCLMLTITTLQAGVALAQTPQPTPEQRADMLRQCIAASTAQLQDYQWYTTTVVTVDGEKKSDIKDRCYYGQNGAIQKVDMGDSVEHGKPMPGLLLPGKLFNLAAKHKEEELKHYINSAIALLHAYIPPTSTDIQAAIHAGLMSVNVLEPGRKVELVFHNFRKSGDQLGVQIELPSNRLLGLSVTTYVENPDEPITVNVIMNVMTNGIIYTESVALQDPEKELEITVTNSGYERIKQ